MEFAQAAAGLGLRAIHGAEMALEDGRHVTLLVEDATGWRNLCRIVTAAHAHDRDKGEPPPRVPLATLEEHAARARLPERLRAPGRPRRAGPAAAAGGSSAPTTCASSSSGPSTATTARATAASPSWPSASACRAVATGNVHAHARSRAPLQDAFVALRNHATLDASEPCGAATSPTCSPRPAAMAARFAEDHPRRGRRDARARRPPDLRPHARTSATATPARRTRRPTARSPSCARSASRSATRPAARTAPRRARAWRRSCG